MLQKLCHNTLFPSWTHIVILLTPSLLSAADAPGWPEQRAFPPHPISWCHTSCHRAAGPFFGYWDHVCILPIVHYLPFTSHDLYQLQHPVPENSTTKEHHLQQDALSTAFFTASCCQRNSFLAATNLSVNSWWCATFLAVIKGKSSSAFPSNYSGCFLLPLPMVFSAMDTMQVFSTFHSLSVLMSTM